MSLLLLLLLLLKLVMVVMSETLNRIQYNETVPYANFNVTPSNSGFILGTKYTATCSIGGFDIIKNNIKNNNNNNIQQPKQNTNKLIALTYGAIFYFNSSNPVLNPNKINDELGGWISNEGI